jgi:hypothetical protein
MHYAFKKWPGRHSHEEKKRKKAQRFEVKGIQYIIH